MPARAFKIILFAVVLAGFSLPAQHPASDSLAKLISAAPPDSQKVKWLNQLTWECFGNAGYEQGMRLAIEAATLSEKLAYPDGLAAAWNNIGIAHKNLGNYAAALEAYYKTLTIWEKLGSKQGIASTYNNIGVIYKNEGDYDKALEKYRVALRIREELGDPKSIASSLNNIGLVYSAQRNFDTALVYYKRALALGEKNEDSRMLPILLNNIGTIYDSKKDYANALLYYTRTLELEKRHDNRLAIATSYLNIASVLIKAHGLGKAREAEAHLNQALSISLENGHKDNAKDCYSALSDLHALTGRHKQALEEYKLYIVYRDSLFNEESTKKSVQAEMNFEFEKKEAAARLEQEKKEAVAAAEGRRQRIILASVTALGLLLLAFAIFAWRSFLQKKKANFAIRKQKDLIEAKQKEILDSIMYARRIQRSLLPHETVIHRTLGRLARPRA
jgi:tetratricopeptide (TPR) repeat protein